MTHRVKVDSNLLYRACALIIDSEGIEKECLLTSDPYSSAGAAKSALTQKMSDPIYKNKKSKRYTIDRWVEVADLNWRLL